MGQNPFAFGIFHLLQSKILYKGDQILKVNGVDVRRLTCDQIVSILRVAVYSNGYALVQVNRQVRCEEDALINISKDENGNLRYCYQVNDDDDDDDDNDGHLATDNNNATLPISFSDITGLNQPAICARVRNNLISYLNKKK
uniref:PDZ domain-containing protein n=1 Tax=Elaeophora elaphi TaxID=1147741 RepID=A0A0R3RKC9_9BILA